MAGAFLIQLLKEPTIRRHRPIVFSIYGSSERHGILEHVGPWLVGVR